MQNTIQKTKNTCNTNPTKTVKTRIPLKRWKQEQHESH